MVDKPRRFEWVAGIVLVISAAIYALSLSRTYVGFYYDDADYILTAMALIRGHFMSLRLPGQSILHSHWPGFSFLLAPFIPLVQPHWSLLKAVPFACVLGCGVLIERWWRRRFPLSVAIGLLALFAWNPSTVERAGAVMTEPLFLLILLMAILILEYKPQGTSRGWTLGLVAAAATFVRPEGALLTLALGLALYFWGDEREALTVCLPTMILTVLYFIFHFIGWLPLPGYWGDWWSNAPAFDAAAWIHQAGVQSLTLFAGTIFNLPLPHTHLLWLLGMILTLLGWLLCGMGILKLWQDETRRVQTTAIIVFCSTYFIFHVFWPVIDRRFLWPLLPFVFYLGLSALGNLEDAARPRKRALFLILLVLFASYGWTEIQTLRMSESESSFTRLPRESLDWISTHVSVTDRILTNNPSMVYLYTNRPAIGLQQGVLRDAATFFYACVAGQITTLVYFPPPPTFANLPETDTLLGQWEKSQQWADARIYAYEKVFAAPQEGVAIYHIQSNTAYLQAYGLYLSAMIDFSKNNALWGKAKLTEALREDPEFPEAHTAYALVLLATGGSVTDAETSLKHSLRLDPTYPPTLTALLRISQAALSRAGGHTTVKSP